MNANPPVLVLIVPFYNDEELVASTSEVLLAKLKDWRKEKLVDEKSYCCFIDDGSSDGTWNEIEKVAGDDCQALRLVFNSGHQNALLAGLRTVAESSDCSITLDSDLQDDIEAIPKMLEHYRNGCDVVFGVRNERSSDSAPKRLLAGCFYFVAKMLGVAGIPNHADFRLLSRRAMIVVREFSERHLYLRGLVPNLGLSSAQVKYQRKPRMSGVSKYTPAKLFALALSGITSYSVVPLRFIAVLGISICIFSAMYALWVFAGYKSGYTVPGWTSLIVSLYFLGGLIMLSLGITGEYIGKIFIESKKRPLYVIDKIAGRSIIDKKAQKQENTQ